LYFPPLLGIFKAETYDWLTIVLLCIGGYFLVGSLTFSIKSLNVIVMFHENAMMNRAILLVGCESCVGLWICHGAFWDLLVVFNQLAHGIFGALSIVSYTAAVYNEDENTAFVCL
jgi:hypothetical protein